MAASPLSRLQRGLYWTLALAFAAASLTFAAADAVAKAPKPKPAKARPKAAAPAADPMTEWELINGAAVELREKLAKQPRNESLRDRLADLAVRSAAGAERSLAIGDASLFDSYRRQFKELFHDTAWRIGRRAGQGDNAAEFAAGVLALHGFLAPADVAAACKHFLAALEKGYAGAKFRAANCLANDEPARAEALMREASAAGHPAAAELVGRACLEAKPPDSACAWEHMTMAASAGRSSAQSLLAWMYAQGFGGRAADLPRAARLYLQAARKGDASAQNNVGELYETGRGLPADPKQAADWYRKAAEADFAPGQYNLGRLYAAGTGVAKDPVQARSWLEKADRGGVAPARALLDWMDKQDAIK